MRRRRGRRRRRRRFLNEENQSNESSIGREEACTPVWVSFSFLFFLFFHMYIYIYSCAMEPRDEPSIMMDRASSFYQSFKRDRASIIEERRSISQRGRRYSLSMGDSLKRSQSWFATIIDHWRRAWRSA